MSRIPLRVIKLGGSLLNQAGLAARFSDWYRRQPPAVSVLVVGGGPLVDTLRQAEELHHVGEQTMHWLSIRAMSINAQLVASLMHAPAPVATLEALHGVPIGQLLVFDVEPMLRDGEPQMAGHPLPHGWHVTSDSIAARVAEIAGADELVLLKSAPGPEGCTRQTAAEANYVDDFFPQAARDLSTVRCVDLRDAGFRQSILLK